MLTPYDDIVTKFDHRALEAAKRDDNRHRLHAEAATSEATASPYFKTWFKDFVTSVIASKSKLKQLRKQFIWPPVSVELVDEIVDMASAVHHAEDRFIKLDFTDASLEADWEQFAEKAAIQQFITRNCHSSLFSRPNSLVVIDLPAIQVTPFPEPYVYLLALDRVRAIKALNGPSDSGLLEFVWFDTDVPGVTALFDTVDITLFKQDATGKWQEITGSKVAHNQPYCPVFKMWDDVEDSNPLTSNTMLRPLLGLLDRLLFWDSGGESNDLASAFMMLWYLEKTTDTSKPAPPLQLGSPGLVQDIRPVGTLDDGTPYAPVRQTVSNEPKADNTIYGPGTTLPVPAPQTKEDADMRPPAGFIAPQVENLKYIADKVVNLRQRIRQTATGYDGGSTAQPINETQVMQILERSRLIYQYLAEHYEVLTKRILDTVARYRYGAYFKGSAVSLGRRVSLLTGDQLITLYQAAKDAGLGAWLLEELTKQQQEYFARTDASRKLRFKVMRDLTDYPNLSPDELYNLGINTSDPEGYTIAVSLLGFIYRFERENDLSIEQFCNAPDYENRISQIKTSFTRYGSERKPVEPIVGSANPANDPNNPRNGGKGGKSGAKPTGKGRASATK
ncbi:hypothetical protein [Spirosoma litoris]